MIRKWNAAQVGIGIAVVLLVIINQARCKEYGEGCVSDSDCISFDTSDPLICLNLTTSTTPTPTTLTTTPPPTTTAPTATPTTSTPPPTTTASTTVTNPTTSSPSTTTTHQTTTTTTTPTSPLTVTSTPRLKKSPPLTHAQSANSLLELRKIYFPDDYLSNVPKIAEIESRCGCPPNLVRHVDLNRCVSPPLGNCDVRPTNGQIQVTCTKFANCFNPNNDNGTKGTCYCESDAVEDALWKQCKLSHGSPRCQKRTDCDISNHLTCRSSDNTCVCEYDNIQKWNRVNATCGLNVGESCLPTQTFRDPVCVENAFCNNKTCECSNGYLETPNKDCKLPHNAVCSNDDGCHPFFQCSNSTCTCPPGLTYFESTQTCHLPAGASCNPEDTCTLHAQCLNGVCGCQPGFKEAGQSCQALYGQKCSNETQCHEHSFLGSCDIQSINPVCDCKPSYSYHEVADRCVGNIEEACVVDEDCVDHAICHLDACTCGGTYIPGTNKTACYTRYGESCKRIECYPGHFLACGSDSVCTCANHNDLIYDDEKQYCVALANRQCGVTNEGQLKCVEFSTCSPAEGSLLRCKCYADYTLTNDGRCINDTQADSSSTKITVVKVFIPLLSILLIFTHDFI